MNRILVFSAVLFLTSGPAAAMMADDPRKELLQGITVVDPWDGETEAAFEVPQRPSVVNGATLGNEPVFGGAGWGPTGDQAGQIERTITYFDNSELTFKVRCPTNDHTKGTVTFWDTKKESEDVGKTFKFPDYKGRPIRVPDETMIGWWKTRRISKFVIQRMGEGATQGLTGLRGRQNPVTRNTANTGP